MKPSERDCTPRGVMRQRAIATASAARIHLWRPRKSLRRDRDRVDFTNGFHDTANAVATSIATGALKPRVAVMMSAVLNLVGAFISIKVAATIAKGIVDTKVLSGSSGLALVFAALIGAIMWNLITWYFTMPSSSSHALIGGVIGATIFAASFIGGAGLVILFGLRLIGVSRAKAARSADNAGSRVVNLAGSAICGVICVALVVVGIYAMAKKPATPKAKPAAKAALVAPPRAA